MQQMHTSAECLGERASLRHGGLRTLAEVCRHEDVLESDHASTSLRDVCRGPLEWCSSRRRFRAGAFGFDVLQTAAVDPISKRRTLDLQELRRPGLVSAGRLEGPAN